MKKLIIAALFALAPVLALAQGSGTIPAHSIPISKGSGITGWTAGGPCSAGQALVWSSITSNPTCQTASNSFANPTAQVGLTAINGTANTVMRSDAAPALDQTISPTMTGTWRFTIGPTAPTAAVGTNTTQLATTAFVQAAANAGEAQHFYNHANAVVATISSTVQTVILDGYYAANDGGEHAMYIRTANACTGANRFNSADGQCWQLFQYGPAYPDWLGATVNNASHDAGAAIAALYAAGWKTVILHSGNYYATSSFAMPSYTRFTGESLSSALFKQFNGDQITSMGDSAVIDNLQLYGNGNIYTGRAVVCTTGGHQWIHDVIFAASSNHEVEVIGDGACSEMEIERAIISSYNGATFYGIKLPDSEALTVGLRRFSNLTGAGSFLIDLGGSDQTWVSHSDGTSIKWNDGTNFAKVTDSRLAFAPVIKGQGNVTSRNTISTNIEVTATAVNNIIADNVIAGGITLDSGVTGVVVTESNRFTTGGTVTDNSGNFSNLYLTKQTPMVPVASLPACTAARAGMRYMVTDAASVAFGGLVSGGGGGQVVVFCNNSGWVMGMNDNLERKVA